MSLKVDGTVAILDICGTTNDERATYFMLGAETSRSVLVIETGRCAGELGESHDLRLDGRAL